MKNTRTKYTVGKAPEKPGFYAVFKNGELLAVHPCRCTAEDEAKRLRQAERERRAK